ncbi:MAG: undecaprenyl-diphosphate phosphatase [Elusimicrobiota bacterium]|jgi:undecaprenyl-diphosphatase
MSLWHAAVLGILQATGEFLPISSSGHLVLMPWLLGWTYQGKIYDVALHLGTLIAVCAYFWKDWLGLLRAGCSRTPSPEHSMFWRIILATIPGGLAGLLLDKHVEAWFHEPWLIASNLMAFGVVLWWSDHNGRKTEEAKDLSLRSCLLIGLAQALAIIPGVSRSGITLTAGLGLGLKREAAARFSFLLSVPIVVAAGLMKLRHVGPEARSAPFWVGVVMSAVLGWLCIRFLLNYLKENGTGLFVAYRVLFGLFCLAWAFI